jgi:hypothetical protein
LVSNLGRGACAVPPAMGEVLFESRAGAGQQVRGGRLEGPATAAFLQPAP